MTTVPLFDVEAPAATTAAGPRPLEPHTASRACYIRGCRRPECKAEDYRYMSALRLDHHRGQRRRTDATQSRHHIERLTAAGWAQVQIARAAGLCDRTIGDIVQGAPTISNQTAYAILSIPIGPAPLEGREVDATGSMRRIQALVAIGWSLAQQAPRLGFYVTDLGLIANGRRQRVRATTAEAIARGYRYWARVPGPGVRARNEAVRRGWAGPAAWDEATIDDAAAVPDIDQSEPDLKRGELAELRRQEVIHLAGFGTSAEEIAARLGIGFTTVTGILAQQRRAAS